MFGRHRNHREGATMVLIVILLPAILALSALAINIAQMETANTDIQIVSDAAVRSAGRVFALTGSKNDALQAAQEAASKNPIGNFVLPIQMSDLDFGISQRNSTDEKYSFQIGTPSNAVRLTTQSFSDGAGQAIEPVFPFFGSSFEVRPRREAISTQGTIDIALAVDRSGSMAYSASEVAAYPPVPSNAPAGWDFGQPVPPNARWLDLIAAVQVFAGVLEKSPHEELLSLTMYNHDAIATQPLSSDYDLTIADLVQVSHAYQKGGTNIGEGMFRALKTLQDDTYQRPHASKVIVLLTDGVHNYGWNPLSASNRVSNAGAILFAITFSDEADQALMQEVAERCGGAHFHAVNGEELKEAFREIARRLPTLITK